MDLFHLNILFNNHRKNNFVDYFWERTKFVLNIDNMMIFYSQFESDLATDK